MKPYNTIFKDVPAWIPQTKKIDTSVKINIRCAEPVIIVNPKLKRELPRLQYIHFPNFQHLLYDNYRRNWYSFNKYLNSEKKQCDYDNISDFYTVTFDGEIIPLYILVPCNKCFICRDRLSQMWQFRGIAESNYSTNKTYFITLTFNDDFLPSKGVDIRDVQLFLKRLRLNLDKLSISHNLKYFACGEYGKNTKRPHYHLILWHFPDDNSHFPNVTSVIHFIEDSWRVYDFNEQKHYSIGFARCKVCNSGSLKYVMKYTRKISVIPEGKNDVFFCCSKYIGIQWFYDNYDFLKKNPQVLTLSIKDPLLGKTFTSPYPTYYKQKIMPSFCKFFPAEVVSAFEKILYLHKHLVALNELSLFRSYKCPDILLTFYKLYYNEDFTDFNYLDDYTYHRYSRLSDDKIFARFQELSERQAIYSHLLDSFYKSINLISFNESNNLSLKRNKLLSIKQMNQYTLDQLRIENEKLENWRKKELDREYI